jgi:hypothetical protein
MRGAGTKVEDGVVRCGLISHGMVLVFGRKVVVVIAFLLAAKA